MAFPTIPTVGAGRVLFSLNTSPAGTHTFPSLSSLTKNAGDTLLAIVIIYDGNSTNAEFSSWGASFTERGDFAGTTTMGIGVASKISTGSETGTFTVTSADTSTNDSCCILLSIPGGHDTTPPEVGSFATGTSAAADPASFNPSGWDAEDTLWIAVGGSGETSTTGSYTGMASAPANYTDYASSGISADVVGGVEGAVAFRQLNAASEDVGTFSVDTSNARNAALVIAVRPAAVTDTLVTPGTASLTTTRFAPTVIVSDNKLVVPGTASLTTTRFTPTVSVTNHVLVTPGIGTLTLTGFAPTVLTPRVVIPGVGTLTLTPFAPTVTVGVRVIPGIATLTLTGFAPTVLTPRVVVPGTATLTLTGFAPTVLTPRVVIPGIGTLVLTAFAPTVEVGSASITVIPGTASLVLTAYPPTVTIPFNCYAIADTQFKIDSLDFFAAIEGKTELEIIELQKRFLLAHGARYEKRNGAITIVGGMYPVLWCDADGPVG